MMISQKPLSAYIKPVAQRKQTLKVPPTQEKIQTELEIKKQVTQYLRKLHFITVTAYLGGIPTGGGKLIPNPMKGFPDMIVMKPTEGVFFLIELKKSHGGLLSEEQIAWHNDLRKCNIIVMVVNSLQSLKSQLKEHGYG